MIGEDDERIDVILDNLSAYKDRAVRRWTRDNRAELCFTPTYISNVQMLRSLLGGGRP